MLINDIQSNYSLTPVSVTVRHASNSKLIYEQVIVTNLP